MLKAVPYKPEHLTRMRLQEAQEYLTPFLTPELATSLASDYSYAAVDGDDVVCCAGLIPMWEGRATAWAYVGKVTPRRFVVLHKMVERFLQMCPFDRVEAAVDVKFEEGHRWVKALGFTLEAPAMRKFSPEGGDSALYARVRD